jgi:hypothetical protein
MHKSQRKNDTLVTQGDFVLQSNGEGMFWVHWPCE